MTLRLDIRQHQQLCVVFHLSWGKGQWCSAELPYPELLMQQYSTWQTSYLNFYRHLSIPPALPVIKPVAESELELRGRVDAIGSFAATEDWRSNLVQAEAQLLAEFHRWLNSSQLAEIRKQIAQIVQQRSGQESRHVDVFLTCNGPPFQAIAPLRHLCEPDAASLPLDSLRWSSWCEKRLRRDFQMCMSA
ncbi:hypothetical protein [Leptolyngbya sp. 7M]|uniref:hypothetical protein n=1 Tax=Leptolyngbya sp. 7M TaxID=2812896 RepID=UPI001B8A8D3C|nr:hypothetical protein [Leptolyngbya sp. 7M]QYO64449.1 hypothetical protein JVX88_33010 [Leptolyngbya sp. 7M]